LALSTELGLNLPRAVTAVTDLQAEKIYIADTGNNRVVLASLPEDSPLAIWNVMKQHLLAGDIAGALPYFASVSVEKYRYSFLSISAADLIPMITSIPAITPVFIEGDTAQYRFERMIQGVTITFPVLFSRENGLWKVVEF
jgi:hypothetical protein